MSRESIQMDFASMVTEFPPPTEAELDKIIADKPKKWLEGYMFGYLVGSQDRYQEHLECCKLCKLDRAEGDYK